MKIPKSNLAFVLENYCFHFFLFSFKREKLFHFSQTLFLYFHCHLRYSLIDCGVGKLSHFEPFLYFRTYKKFFIGISNTTSIQTLLTISIEKGKRGQKGSKGNLQVYIY